MDDLIDLQSNGGDLRPVNVNEARIRGIELGSGFRANDWDLAVKLTLIDPRDRETDNRLRRRSHQSLRVDLDR